MNKSGTFETPLNTKVPPENKAIGEGDITDLTQKRYEQDTRWRSRLSRWVIIIDSAWLCAIIVILWFNDGCFKLSDNVLMVHPRDNHYQRFRLSTYYSQRIIPRRSRVKYSKTYQHSTLNTALVFLYQPYL